MKPKALKPLTYLILSAKGWGTGSALRAFYITEALREKGHTVYFPKPLPTLPFWLDMALSKPYYFFYSLGVRSDIAFCVKPYPMAVQALWVQRMKGAKIIFDVDDLDYAYSHGIFKTFHQWLQKPWPRWADYVTYHNPLLRKPILDFFKVPPSKLFQVPQGVNSDIFNSKPLETHDLPQVAASLHKKKPSPLFVFTAHLNVACDLEPVLRAFEMLLKKKPGAKLLVAGGGPDEGKFKRMALDLSIAPSVYFTGLITPRQVAACLKISDAVLVYYSATPANEHRASMKLREALACGCRVVATKVGEIASFKKLAVLSEANPQAFAQASQEALRAKKAPREASSLVKKWDWTQSVEPLERIR